MPNQMSKVLVFSFFAHDHTKSKVIYDLCKGDKQHLEGKKIPNGLLYTDNLTFGFEVTQSIMPGYLYFNGFIDCLEQKEVIRHVLNSYEVVDLRFSVQQWRLVLEHRNLTSLGQLVRGD